MCFPSLEGFCTPKKRDGKKKSPFTEHPFAKRKVVLWIIFISARKNTINTSQMLFSSFYRKEI